MQDAATPPEDPGPKIVFVVRDDAEPNPAARKRLLEILFGPRPDSEAA